MREHKQKLITISGLIGYLPLAVNLLARHLSHTSQDIMKIIHQLKKEGLQLEELGYEDKNLSYALKYTYEHLSPAVAKIFISLAVFEGRDFPLPAISLMCKLSAEKTERLLEQLINLSLVEYSTKGRYRIHPFVKQFIQSKASISDIAYENIVSYYEQFLARGGRGVIKFYPAIEEELKNILGVFSECYKRKYYCHIIKLWEHLGVFLWDTGRWNLMDSLGNLVLTAAKKEKDWSAYIRCCIRELSWLHYWQGEIAKAEVYVRRGIKVAKILNDGELMALAWIRFGKILVSKRRVDEALQYFQRALVYFKKIHNREKQGDIITYIGETYWLMGQQRKAKYYLHRALRIVNAIKDIPQKTTIITRLGCIALQEKFISRAIEYFEKSLLLEQESGRRVGDTFWNNLALGLAYEMGKKYEKAKENFQLAKQEMVLIGFTEKILWTDVFPLVFRKELRRSRFFTSSTQLS